MEVYRNENPYASADHRSTLNPSPKPFYVASKFVFLHCSYLQKGTLLLKVSGVGLFRDILRENECIKGEPKGGVAGGALWTQTSEAQVIVPCSGARRGLGFRV